MADVTYTPTSWVAGGAPAINATRLNNIETGITDLVTAVNGKIDSSGAELDSYSETASVNASAGAAITYGTHNDYDTTLTANLTVTLTCPVSTGKMYSITAVHRQDSSGGRTVTWPASVKWPNGARPSESTAASAINIWTVFTVDGGTTWFGFLVGRAMA